MHAFQHPNTDFFFNVKDSIAEPDFQNKGSKIKTFKKKKMGRNGKRQHKLT